MDHVNGNTGRGSNGKGHIETPEQAMERIREEAYWNAHIDDTHDPYAISVAFSPETWKVGWTSDT
eukprot:9185234-Lingulodinium_polyedra.AAC.1